MEVREFPFLPIHNLKDDDPNEQMQLEIKASRAGASENTLDQIMQQDIAEGIREAFIYVLAEFVR